MLTEALLVITIVASRETSIHYQKLESMESCQAVVLRIEEYNEDGVNALCVPLEKIIEA